MSKQKRIYSAHLSEKIFARMVFTIHGDELQEFMDCYFPHIERAIRRFQLACRKRMARINHIHAELVRLSDEDPRNQNPVAMEQLKQNWLAMEASLESCRLKEEERMPTSSLPFCCLM